MNSDKEVNRLKIRVKKLTAKNKVDFSYHRFLKIKKDLNKISDLKKDIKKKDVKKKKRRRITRSKGYHSYIKSSKWFIKRVELFKERGRNCEKCGDSKNIQVHHKTYKNLFNEPLKDLMVVCKSCHEKIHNRQF